MKYILLPNDCCMVLFSGNVFCIANAHCDFQFVLYVIFVVPDSNFWYFLWKVLKGISPCAPNKLLIHIFRYLSFTNMLNGFEMLTQKLYGVSFRKSLPEVGEIWPGNIIKLVRFAFTFISLFSEICQAYFKVLWCEWNFLAWLTQTLCKICSRPATSDSCLFQLVWVIKKIMKDEVQIYQFSASCLAFWRFYLDCEVYQATDFSFWERQPHPRSWCRIFWKDSGLHFIKLLLSSNRSNIKLCDACRDIVFNSLLVEKYWTSVYNAWSLTFFLITAFIRMCYPRRTSFWVQSTLIWKSAKANLWVIVTSQFAVQKRFFISSALFDSVLFHKRRKRTVAKSFSNQIPISAESKLPYSAQYKKKRKKIEWYNAKTNRVTIVVSCNCKQQQKLQSQ